MQSEIDADLMKVDEQGDERLKSLVKIYETMKPQDAARIFAQMDMPVLLELLTRMKELKTAGILANMDPDKAREITVALAAKKELPPDLKNAAQAN
jgi:flagellar motility protein MotE (MotC chaperone)